MILSEGSIKKAFVKYAIDKGVNVDLLTIWIGEKMHALRCARTANKVAIPLCQDVVP